MKSLNILLLKRLAFAAVAAVTLSACAVSPEGPAGSGNSHGSLGSSDMCTYYYHKDAGWTYVYRNVEHIYSSSNYNNGNSNDNMYASSYSNVTTLTGANDTVRTLGFDGFAPNGDSLFRYQVSYRVLSSYAGRDGMDIYYVSSTGDDNSHGAFVADGITNIGQLMQKRPRPVSTDTILAGIAGLIRTRVDDFSNNGNYVWQMDTLWCSSHGDSVYIWEHQGGNGPIVQERCIFIKNFNNNVNWTYDVINNPNPTTFCMVADPDFSFTGSCGTYSHTAALRIKTNEVDDKQFNREWKFYACGTGPVYQYDWWYLTSDGQHYVKQDFTRSLISLTHN